MRLSRRALFAASASFVLAHVGVVRVTRADALDDVLARIARARAPVRTLVGPFTQTRTIGLLATAVRSQGSLTLVRPDRLRWELAPPDEVTFFIGPEGLAYKSAHGQARVPASDTRIGASLDDLRVVLGGDLSKLRDRWDLRVLRDDASGVEIEATARDPSKAALRSMRFALAPDLVRPSRAVLVEGPRDKTVIEFGALTIDAPVDEARMRLP
jgi:hypothetical protein